MAIIQPPGINARRAVVLKTPQTRRAQRVHIRGFTGITGRTSHVTAAMAGGYTWVRAWFANDSATPFTVDKLTFAATAVATDSNPRDAGGTSIGGWVQGWFDGAGVDTLPGSTAQTAASITVPAGTAANPSYVCSDWLLLAPIDRADGDWRRYLMCRAYTSGASRWATRPDLTWDSPTVNLGRLWTMYDGAGDQTTTATLLTEGLRGATLALEAISDRSGHVFMAVGDSLTQGQGSTSDYATWGHIASAALSTSALPMSFVNAGWSGQTTLQFYDRGRGEIARFRPTICAIAPWSPNDTLDLANAQRGYSRAMAMAQQVRDGGGIPVFWTPMPTDRITTTTQEDARLWVVNKLRGLRDSGNILLADFDVLLTDGAYPARIKASLTVDGTHLNDAGYALCGGAMQAVLRLVAA
ncbi:SGNH/GDSL hydrolase family protein [Rhodovarius crocodyli]|uniref:SGNH/GDSL hydrolase family protein n=1 Tax=Rhodovarius crocodyli TaxID=1979269 RepID=A0A437MC98_9PROT|nr:SGNH/GDSL hydrolase family protein [Rhodovarius crocodyli]RVT95269.1 SGNH/GDSL hydrolase family protein [Rhodovarius crocodyli]